MPPEKKLLISRDIWTTAWATLRATSRQWLLLLVFGLIVPQILLNALLDVQSTAVVAALREVFTSKGAASGSPVGFTVLLAPALAYFGRLAMALVFILVPFLASFLALVTTAVDHHRDQPCRGCLRAWLAGLRLALPALLVGALTIVLLAVAGQVFLAPALVVAVLALVIPVILVAERQGSWRTLWTALTMRYAQASGYSSWTVFFNLISLSAFFYAALAAAGLVSDGLLFMDEHLGLNRGPWTLTFGEFPFGPVYALVAIVESVLTMTILAALPALTAALYFIVRRGGGGRPIAQA